MEYKKFSMNSLTKQRMPILFLFCRVTMVLNSRGQASIINANSTADLLSMPTARVLYGTVGISQAVTP